jgi:hypothetical protein
MYVYIIMYYYDMASAPELCNQTAHQKNAITCRKHSMRIIATTRFVQDGLKGSEAACGERPSRRSTTSDINAKIATHHSTEPSEEPNDNSLGGCEIPGSHSARGRTLLMGSVPGVGADGSERESERSSTTLMLAGIAASPFAMDAASMCMLQSRLGLSWPSMQLPSLLPPSDSVLQPWVLAARALLQAYTPALLSNGLSADVAIAQLSQASSTALHTSHPVASGLVGDPFLLLVFLALGCVNKAATFCTALMQLPGTPCLWPAFGRTVCGRRPILRSIHAVRCMLFREDREEFAWLQKDACIDLFAEACLASSFLHVLSSEACVQLFALSTVSGPLVLVAAVVAALQLLRDRIKCHMAHGELKEWLLNLSMFTCPPDVIVPRVASLLRKHQASLLPLLLSDTPDQ